MKTTEKKEIKLLSWGSDGLISFVINRAEVYNYKIDAAFIPEYVDKFKQQPWAVFNEIKRNCHWWVGLDGQIHENNSKRRHNMEFKELKKIEKATQAKRQVRRIYNECHGTYFHFQGKKWPWTIKMKPRMEKIYTTTDVCRILKIKKERLQDWINRGFVNPNVPAMGKGGIAVFTHYRILRIALFKELLSLGFKREKAVERMNAGPVTFSVELYGMRCEMGAEYDSIIRLYIHGYFGKNM